MVVGWIYILFQVLEDSGYKQIPIFEIPVVHVTSRVSFEEPDVGRIIDLCMNQDPVSWDY